MRRRHGRRFAPGVRATLALLALLPFAGLVWFSVQALERAADRVDGATDIETGAPEVTELAVLAGHLSNEVYWASAVTSATSLGVPPELLVQVAGIDLVALRDDAMAATDWAVGAAGVDEVRAVLATARATAADPGATTRAVEDGYEPVERVVEGQIQDRVQTLRRTASEIPGNLELLRRADALAIAVELRGLASRVAFGFYAARYPVASANTTPFVSLQRSTALYDAAVERLQPLIDRSSDLERAWATLTRDASVRTLLTRAEVSALSGTSLDDDGFISTLDLAELDIEAEAASFRESILAVDRHLPFVEAAANELTAVAGAIRTDAEASQRRVVVSTAGFALASLVAVALAAVWIVRPLRRMAEVAHAMQNGELGGHVTPAGPRELRSMARALNETADHLQLVERQAVALAEEDLDHPSLADASPGKLGASLQHAVGRLARSLAEREEFVARLEHEATHDGLTGLLNRTAAMESLARGLARTSRSVDELAVLFIDVDEFKVINDRHGHNVGDVVLRTIADRIRSAIRDGDLACRLGGDEFLVVADPISDPHEAMTVARRVLELVRAPIEVAATEIHPAVSVGVAVTSDSDLSADELLRDADLAVYRAKELGRGRAEFCDVGLRSESVRRTETEAALRAGVENGELVVHYQPVVDREDAVVSLEALVRWERPGHGLVAPDEFLTVAKSSDLVVDIDAWVLQTVVRRLAGWSGHPVLGSVPVAVNVSERTLAGGGLAEAVLGSIAVHGVDARRLVLDVSEGALRASGAVARSQLERLRRNGVVVALDDFGTGATSINDLRDLPVDVLKIDGSFVHNIDDDHDRSMVQLMVETGHLLGASVIAEQVETLEQAEALVRMGSDQLQGFRYGVPMDADALEASLDVTQST